MKDRLRTHLLPGLVLENPLLSASGCFGAGLEGASTGESGILGAIVTKTVTLRPRAGNPPPRIFETSGGLLNSIGLANPGIESFLERDLPGALALGPPVIVNIGGETSGEYAALAERLQDSGAAALEVNLSCPNVQGGSLPFSTDPDACRRVVSELRRATDLPLFVKLSPNTHAVVEVACAAVEGGADGLTLINTLLGMAVDWRRRRPRIGMGVAGYSGPPVKPVALRIVHQVRRAVGVPILGVGGIQSAEDVCEFLVAGASAVQIGTAWFTDPRAGSWILSRLERLLAEEDTSVDDLVDSMGKERRSGRGHGCA